MSCLSPVPPTLSGNVPSNATIIENQRIIMPCPIDGNPPPLITWYKDNVVVTGNELGLRLLGDGALQLDHAQATDTGLYECVASNAAGNYSHVMELSVFCEYNGCWCGNDHCGSVMLRIYVVV